MSKDLKYIIALLITILMAVSLYFGSYLPLRKAQYHINAVMNLQSGKIRSIGDFNNLFDPVLNFYSPVGQDEITQYYLGILLNIINQQSDRAVIDALVKQAEQRAAPVLEAGRGFNFNQNLYTFGSIYKIAAIKFKDKGYYDKAVNIFNIGLKYSPNRLIFLKGLFDLYSANIDDQQKAKEIGEIILKYYPGETSVKKFLDSQ